MTPSSSSPPSSFIISFYIFLLFCLHFPPFKRSNHLAGSNLLLLAAQDKAMGEVGGAKNEGEKKDDGNLTVVLKMNMHCEGCAKKVRRAVRSFEGVEDVKADISSNKLTVTGKVNPSKIKERLEEKTGKKVEIISPQPKNDAAAPAGDKKPDEKKPAEEKKEEDKKPKQATVVLKIQLHCDGCIQKIKKIIMKIKGVEAVSIDVGKDLVTVTGTMDDRELIRYLRDKLRRGVEVVPPPAKKDDAGGNKKEGKESGGGDKKEAKESAGGDKKEGKEAAAAAVEKKDGGGSGEKGKSKEVKAEESSGPMVEISKFEHHGYYQSQPSYWYDQGQSSYYSHGYAVDPYVYHGGYTAPPPPAYSYPVPEGYSHYPQYPGDPRLHAPQMFSDENPNACSIM